MYAQRRIKYKIVVDIQRPDGEWSTTVYTGGAESPWLSASGARQQMADVAAAVRLIQIEAHGAAYPEGDPARIEAVAKAIHEAGGLGVGRPWDAAEVDEREEAMHQAKAAIEALET